MLSLSLLWCLILGTVQCGQSADLALDFNFNSPNGVAVDEISDALFVADELNGRVVRYDNRSALTNSSTQSLSFGQPNLTSTGANIPGVESGLNRAGGLTVDNRGTLWISDYQNNRTSWFNDAWQISSMPPIANGVLGQVSLALTTPGTTQATLSGPSVMASLVPHCRRQTKPTPGIPPVNVHTCLIGNFRSECCDMMGQCLLSSKMLPFLST